MAYSIIRKKTCKCGNPKCYPTLSFHGWNFKCAPQEIKDKNGTKKDVAKRNKAARNKVSNLLNKDSDADKTKLLAMADKLFSDRIKERDADKDGNIICPCCKLSYSLKDKASDGTYIVQPLHFVSRGTYSLRFSEENVYAGCCYCNLDMYLHPEGKSVLNYQNKLIDKLGIVEVMRMQAESRKLHKVSSSDLQEIIKKYSKT